MREIKPEEMTKVVAKAAQDNLTTVETLELILPGFKQFIETSPDYKSIVRAKSEATAVLYLYCIARGIPKELRDKLTDVFYVMTAVGYFMREQEGERVPAGATVH